MLGHLGDERIQRLELLRFEQLTIRRRRADLQPAARPFDALELSQLADVDEHVRLGQPEPEERQQAVPAGDDFRMLPHRLERVDEILGAHVFEGGRDHGVPPFAC